MTSGECDTGARSTGGELGRSSTLESNVKYLLAMPIVVVLAVTAWAHLPARSLPHDARIDEVVVHKADRRIELLEGDRVVARYRIALGRQPVGPKRELGDGRTPEGRYIIDFHKPDSDFHRALHVSYPSERDIAEADRRRTVAGGAIMVHGTKPELEKYGRFHAFFDWTDGCIAVTNSEIDQIYRVVRDGTPIRIQP